MPLGKNPKKNMTEITDTHPDWKRSRRLAASLNAAREHGAKIPKSKSGRSRQQSKRRRYGRRVGKSAKG